MAHNTSGLPPLDLQPFDPSDLYAAARSHSSAVTASRRSRLRPVLAGLGLLVGLGLAAAAAVLLA